MSDRCLLVIMALLTDKVFTDFIKSPFNATLHPRLSTWKLRTIAKDETRPEEIHGNRQNGATTTSSLISVEDEVPGVSGDIKTLSGGSEGRTILPFGFEMIAILMGKAFLVAFISILVTAAMGLKTGNYFHGYPDTGEISEPPYHPHNIHHGDTGHNHYKDFNFDWTSINHDYYSPYINPEVDDHWFDQSDHRFYNDRQKQFDPYKNNNYFYNKLYRNIR